MSHATVKLNSENHQSGRFDGRNNVKRKSSNSYKNKAVKKQKSAVNLNLDSSEICNETRQSEHNSNDVQESVIEMFTTARSLLKKPLDYTTLSEVHTRCKIIMKTLENTIESLTDKTSFQQPKEFIKDDSNSNEYSRSEPKMKKITQAASTEIVPKEKINVVEPCKPDPNDEKNHATNIIISPVKTRVGENSSTSSDLLQTLFSPLTASNTWELMQLKQMLADPFISSSRKQCINTRILELNEKIISQLIVQAEGSKNCEVFVLEKLCEISADSSLSSQQKEQVEYILSAFRDKVIRDITDSAIDPDVNYEATIERLNAVIKVPCIPDKEKIDFVTKLIEMRSKLSSDIIKQSNSSVEDAPMILEKIKNLVDDPLLSDRARSRLTSYVGFVRNKSIQVLTSQPFVEGENNEELIKKLGMLLQDSKIPFFQRMKVIEKLQLCESTVSFKLKQSKQKLKETLMSSVNENLLGFEGTNLDFVFGYSVESPPFVRCINLWTPK